MWAPHPDIESECWADLEFRTGYIVTNLKFVLTDTQNPLPTIVDVGSPLQRCLLPTGVEWRVVPHILHLHFQILYSSHFVTAKHWSTYQSCISGVAVVPWSWLIIRITSTNIQPWDIIEWNLSSVWTDQHQVVNTRHMFCYCPDEMTVTPTTFIMVKGGSTNHDE